MKTFCLGYSKPRQKDMSNHALEGCVVPYFVLTTLPDFTGVPSRLVKV